MKLFAVLALSSSFLGLSRCQDPSANPGQDITDPIEQWNQFVNNYDPSYNPPQDQNGIIEVDPVPMSSTGNQTVNSMQRTRPPNGMWIYYMATHRLDGNPTVPVNISKDGQTAFVQKVKEYAKSQAAASASPTSTDPARYFYFSSGDFALVMTAKGPFDYDWNDYWYVADVLEQLMKPGRALDGKNSAVIINGNDNGYRSQLWGALIPSFKVSVNENQVTWLGKRSIESGVRTERRIRRGLQRREQLRSSLSVRDDNPNPWFFGPENQYKMQIWFTGTRVASSVLGALISTAYNDLVGMAVTDNAGPLMRQQQARLPGMSDRFAGNIFQMEAENQGILNDVYREALLMLTQFADAREWSLRAGDAFAFNGRISMNRQGEQLLASFSFGVQLVIERVFCLFENPDGSSSLGCIVVRR